MNIKLNFFPQPDHWDCECALGQQQKVKVSWAEWEWASTYT